MNFRSSHLNEFDSNQFLEKARSYCAHGPYLARPNRLAGCPWAGSPTPKIGEAGSSSSARLAGTGRWIPACRRRNTVGEAVLEHGGDSVIRFEGFREEAAHSGSSSTVVRAGGGAPPTADRRHGGGSRLGGRATL
jgi:hypothetical protein